MRGALLTTAATGAATQTRIKRVSHWRATLEAASEDQVMSMERWIRLIAGTFVVVSVVLARYHSLYWLLFTLFVGLNLFQSALTKWCLMEDILAKLGVAARQQGAKVTK